ncbi:MAG: hypothetical protein ACTH2Q_00265 [Propionibacteriaceae bacterium]
MTQPAPVTGAPVGEDPGKTLGIVGLVLAIIATWIGLIVSVVAFKKSKKAGFSNGVAKAGIVVGIITTIGGLIVGGIMAASIVATVQKCGELGPGVHQEGGVTYTCG